MTEDFEAMLTGGHPNSLGRTMEVVETVFGSPERFDELYLCYRSQDEVVRLRVSNAMRRVEAERHDLLVPYIDRFIEEIGVLDQPSAQWTLAKLFEALRPDMTPAQEAGALAIMRRNLAEHDDWIVLNNTMEALSNWSKNDADLRAWLVPHLERLANDSRKSVSGRARKLIAKI
ncbi:hypothetical protein [uncultured Erythrobacter sp.]|uniref:hypothetical protein n=1 Tax=uncultured Erythrobacter sp. TaxID=263913 RepID=UPI0026197BC0|nr:hypothetical protein [uncultured Erythrobacter sp.]